MRKTPGEDRVNNPGQTEESAQAGPPASPAEESSPAEEQFWKLRLYVAGTTPKSLAALANLKRICEEHLADRYEIERVDLMASPGRAREDQIIAIPTLVRKQPGPQRKAIGDLSNERRVLRILGLAQERSGEA